MLRTIGGDDTNTAAAGTICVLMPLYMCSYTTMCPHTTMLHTIGRDHTNTAAGKRLLPRPIYVSSHYYIYAHVIP